MARIVHISLKCGDRDSLERATEFYRTVFGFLPTTSAHIRGHHSRHMTDGKIDLALMLYDSEDEKEARLSGGRGPKIHHIGFEVADRSGMIKKIEDNGGSIYSDRSEGALKYRASDETLGEIVEFGRYPVTAPSKRGKISNITLRVKDLKRSQAFYSNVFGLSVLSTPQSKVVTRCKLSDGTTRLSLVESKTEIPAIESWSLAVPDLQNYPAAIAKQGGEILSESPDAIRLRGPDGNIAEIVRDDAMAELA